MRSINWPGVAILAMRAVTVAALVTIPVAVVWLWATCRI